MTLSSDSYKHLSVRQLPSIGSVAQKEVIMTISVRAKLTLLARIRRLRMRKSSAAGAGPGW